MSKRTVRTLDTAVCACGHYCVDHRVMANAYWSQPTPARLAQQRRRIVRPTSPRIVPTWAKKESKQP